MARENIGTGTVPNDNTGDTLRVAFNKTNNNFIDIYSNTVPVAANSVAVYANNSLIVPNANINFNNSGSINVTASKSGKLANLQFSLNTSSITSVGSLHQTLTLNSNVTVAQDITVTGNLKVEGNMTSLNVSVLEVEDNDIILNANTTGAPSFNASVTVDRGTSPNTFVRWNEGNDKWGWSDDGSTFYTFETSLNAYAQANAAYGQANTAHDQANNAYGQSNSAYTQANSAYDQANNAYTQANSAYSQSNSAYTQANSAYDQANSAYTAANNAPGTYGNTNVAAYLLTSGIETTNVTSNILNVKEVFESTNLLTSATGTVTHNCADGHIFVHSSISANFTANFTNLTIPANNATTLTLLLTQGATPYVANAVQIGGVAQTIVWQGGTTPTGVANKKDVLTFSVVNNGGSWITLGQLTSFG